jgi:hypothetical protein
MLTLFPERLTRLSFFLRWVIVGVLQLPISLHYDVVQEGVAPLWDWGGILLSLAFLAYSIIFIAIPRGVDIGLSKPITGLLAIIPLLNIPFWLYLQFTKTDARREF